MKKILLLTTILTAFTINAQSIEPVFSVFDVSKSFIDAPTITMDTKGNITVVGDSLTAIKSIFKLCEKLSKDNSNAYLDFYKAVDFINDVPEYFTKNKKFKAYVEATKRQGFISVKRK